MIKFSVRSTNDLTPVQPMYKNESPSFKLGKFSSACVSVRISRI